MVTECHDARSLRWLSACACLLLVTAGGACAGTPDWVQTNPDVAARARSDPRPFVEAAHQRWRSLWGMAGSYQVRASRGTSSRIIDTHIFLLRDDLIEIQVLIPTGQTEGYVVVGESEVGLWFSDENILYRGENRPGAFGRALGLDLAGADIVGVLMGFGARLDGDERIDWDEEQRRIRVRNHGVTAWLHPVLSVFDRVVVDTDSGAIEVDYQEWSPDGAPVPLRMQIHVAAEDFDLELRLARKWSANPDGLEPGYFEILVPNGARTESLDRLSLDGGLLRRGLDR